MRGCGRHHRVKRRRSGIATRNEPNSPRAARCASRAARWIWPGTFRMPDRKAWPASVRNVPFCAREKSRALLPFGAWLAFTTAAIALVAGDGSGVAAVGVFLWGAT